MGRTVDAWKTVLAFLSGVMLVWGVRCGYCASSGMTERFLSMLCHANIFHMAVNVSCLYILHVRTRHLITGLILAYLMTYFPSLTSEPTMGMSGAVFAMLGLIWGESTETFRATVRKLWTLIVIPFLIPNVNASLHLWCFLSGYAAGLLYRSLGHTVKGFLSLLLCRLAPRRFFHVVHADPQTDGR